MPRGGPCNHKACIGSPTGCRMLTDAELTPTEEDIEFAKKLVAEGWVQTSSKFRSVAKLNSPITNWRELVRPELHSMIEQVTQPGLHYTGEEIFQAFKRSAWHHKPWVEHLTLTVKQFQAFKKLNGKVGTWR